MLLLSNLGSNYTVDRAFLSSIGQMCQKDNNTLWLSKIFLLITMTRPKCSMSYKYSYIYYNQGFAMSE